MDLTSLSDINTYSKSAGIFSLPNELLEVILEKLDQNSRIDFACACRLFSKINARTFGANLEASTAKTLVSLHNALQRQEDKRNSVRSLQLSPVHYHDTTQVEILSPGKEWPFLNCLGHQNGISLRRVENLWGNSLVYRFKCELCRGAEDFMKKTLPQLKNLTSLTIKMKIVHVEFPKSLGIHSLRPQIAQLQHLTSVHVGEVDNTRYLRWPELSGKTVYFNVTYQELREILSLPYLQHLHMEHLSGHHSPLHDQPWPSEKLITLKLERCHMKAEQFAFVLKHAGPLERLDLCKVIKIREGDDNQGNCDSHGNEVNWHTVPLSNLFSRSLTFTHYPGSLKRFQHTLKHLTIQHYLEPYLAEDFRVLSAFPALKSLSLPFSTFTEGCHGSGEDCLCTSGEALRADLKRSDFNPPALEYLELTQMDDFCMAAPIVHRILRSLLDAKVCSDLPLKQIMLNNIQNCWMVSHLTETTISCMEYIKAQAGLRPTSLAVSPTGVQLEETNKDDGSRRNRHEVMRKTDAGDREETNAKQTQSMIVPVDKKVNTEFARVCCRAAVHEMRAIHQHAKSIGTDIALAPIPPNYFTRKRLVYGQLDEDPFLFSEGKFYHFGMGNMWCIGEGCLDKYKRAD